MPFTPLAYERLLLDGAAFSAVGDRIRAVVEAHGFEYRLPERFDEYCLSQVLALAPEGSFGLLRALAERDCVYDTGLTKSAWDFARAYLTEHGAFGADFLAEKSREYRFPYSFVKPVVSREAVYRRFLDAKASRERVSCLGATCLGCEACDDDERRFLAAHRLDTATDRDIAAVAAIVAAKRRPHTSYVAADLPRGYARVHPAYAAARFLRALYAAVPDMVDVVWAAEDVFLKSDDGLGRLPGAWGGTWYRLLSSRPVDRDVVEAAGYQILDLPPAVEHLRLELALPGAGLAETSRLVADFLSAASIPCTLRKSGGFAHFAIAPKGVKKRNVLDAAAQASTAGGSIVTLRCGSKYDIGALVALAGKRRLAMDTRVLQPAE